MSSTIERWYWLDWLRVIAMGTIFFYHSGRPFIITPWHIMNPEPDPLFTLVNVFVTGWIMPLFFVISGMATYFSLGKRNALQFAKTRFLRLMVPFIFALFTILYVHVYFTAVFNGDYTGSFFEGYFWDYFLYGFPLDLVPRLTYFAGANQGIYLWYLFWLFVFSLITVHFFKYLREKDDKISKLATICNRRGGIFLLAIPLIIVDLAAIPPFFVFPSGYGGWKLPTYLIFFILAYVVASNSQFMQSIDKNGLIALIVGIVTSVLILVVFIAFGLDVLVSLSGYLLFTPLWAFNGWSWIIALLFLGRKFLSFNHRYLQFSNELVLPFYVLHETVIVAVAFFVVSLNLIVMVKYFIIFSVSFAIISLLLIPIRQINVLRFLFGMRLKKKSA
ncbi:acyltransferase family protein [Candidatus Borrarchaeum sp.]|uniref:acyltransferase family protein n=1 Tax=Candidatus Borrarchaeum sp. TaxID=2846742 RepID=UPI00258035FB|nr:acyltransferase family protein [Candidatus Borrarchaeum sp.]